MAGIRTLVDEPTFKKYEQTHGNITRTAQALCGNLNLRGEYATAKSPYVVKAPRNTRMTDAEKADALLLVEKTMETYGIAMLQTRRQSFVTVSVDGPLKHKDKTAWHGTADAILAAVNEGFRMWMARC